MTIEEAAKRAGVDKRTVQRWITEGRLRTTKLRQKHNWRHDISIDDLIEAEAAVVDACLARNEASGQRVGWNA